MKRDKTCTELKVCGNCKYGKSTSLDDTRCYYSTPYTQTGRHCKACNNWSVCDIVDNPKENYFIPTEEEFLEAARSGDERIIEAYIRHGADVNSVNEYGWSALMLASRHGRTEIVQILLDAGADVNSVNEYGWSALMWASRDGYTEIVKLLLDAGADINIIDEDGWSALMLASRYGHIKIVQILLDAGADVNSVDNDGWSALMRASNNGDTETEILLRHYKKMISRL